MPKGVCYSLFNLITKRFARAAALPEVGEDEVLLSYLPLFHTFGRYLEMMGMLFWGGTYVFAGNPSLESLLAGLREIRPDGPHQHPPPLAADPRAGPGRHGGRRRGGRAARGPSGRSWATACAGGCRRPGASSRRRSASSNRHGVALNSGFGMTEATGGITMTPPGEYEDDSVGIPLPGVTARLSEVGELQIQGPYVARYLDDPPDPEEEYWLETGDIFHQRPSGHYEIVDRIKDIYKNSRGQTVAPAAVERLMDGVPGVKRTFLVGDGRDYNVLLIVPDRDDPVLAASPSPDDTDEYFRQIITTANKELAPYERVVNFALLDRDFDAARDELTPKGSFRRKVIEEHFAETIEALYREELRGDRARGAPGPDPPLVLPGSRGPRDRHRGAGGGTLQPAHRGPSALGRPPVRARVVRVGDLIYHLDGDVVDLGRLRPPADALGRKPVARSPSAPARRGGTFPRRGSRPS